MLRKQREQESKQWEKFSIEQQLAGVLDAFQEQGAQIWGKQAEIPKKVTLHMDTVKGTISAWGDETDAKGRPVSQFDMDKNTGQVTKTRRAKDGSEVHVTETD